LSPSRQLLQADTVDGTIAAAAAAVSASYAAADDSQNETENYLYHMDLKNYREWRLAHF